MSASASSRGTGRKPGRYGREALVGREPGGRRERSHRSAVEGPLQDDDLRVGDAPAVGVLAGQLDRALVRLGPRVAEERLAAQARRAEALGEPHRRPRSGRGSRCGSACRPARAPPRRRRDGSGRPSRPRSRRGSRGTPCPRSPRAARLRRARTRPARAGRSASASEPRAPAARRASSARPHAVIFVPMPASVNSSSSSECGRRPSTMWAASTPPEIASTQAASFGPHSALDRRPARP